MREGRQHLLPPDAVGRNNTERVGGGIPRSTSLKGPDRLYGDGQPLRSPRPSAVRAAAGADLSESESRSPPKMRSGGGGGNGSTNGSPFGNGAAPNSSPMRRRHASALASGSVLDASSSPAGSPLRRDVYLLGRHGGANEEHGSLSSLSRSPRRVLSAPDSQAQQASSHTLANPWRPDRFLSHQAATGSMTHQPGTAHPAAAAAPQHHHPWPPDRLDALGGGGSSGGGAVAENGALSNRNGSNGGAAGGGGGGGAGSAADHTAMSGRSGGGALLGGRHDALRNGSLGGADRIASPGRSGGGGGGGSGGGAGPHAMQRALSGIGNVAAGGEAGPYHGAWASASPSDLLTAVRAINCPSALSRHPSTGVTSPPTPNGPATPLASSRSSPVVGQPPSRIPKHPDDGPRPLNLGRLRLANNYRSQADQACGGSPYARPSGDDLGLQRAQTDGLPIFSSGRSGSGALQPSSNRTRAVQLLLDAVRSKDDAQLVSTLEALRTPEGTYAGVNERHPVTGRTALHEAVMLARTSMVQALLKAGSDPDAAHATQGPALLHAAAWGETEMVELLLDAGSSLSATDMEGSTALHYACCGGHIEAARMLIGRGANTKARTTHGETPFDMARPEVVRKLAMGGGSSSSSRDTSPFSPSPSPTPSSYSGGSALSPALPTHPRRSPNDGGGVGGRSPSSSSGRPAGGPKSRGPSRMLTRGSGTGGGTGSKVGSSSGAAASSNGGAGAGVGGAAVGVDEVVVAQPKQQLQRQQQQLAEPTSPVPSPSSKVEAVGGRMSARGRRRGHRLGSPEAGVVSPTAALAASETIVRTDSSDGDNMPAPPELRLPNRFVRSTSRGAGMQDILSSFQLEDQDLMHKMHALPVPQVLNTTGERRQAAGADEPTLQVLRPRRTAAATTSGAKETAGPSSAMRAGGAEATFGTPTIVDAPPSSGRDQHPNRTSTSTNRTPPAAAPRAGGPQSHAKISPDSNHTTTSAASGPLQPPAFKFGATLDANNPFVWGHDISSAAADAPVANPPPPEPPAIKFGATLDADAPFVLGHDIAHAAASSSSSPPEPTPPPPAFKFGATLDADHPFVLGHDIASRPPAAASAGVTASPPQPSTSRPSATPSSALRNSSQLAIKVPPSKPPRFRFGIDINADLDSPLRRAAAAAEAGASTFLGSAVATFSGDAHASPSLLLGAPELSDAVRYGVADPAATAAATSVSSDTRFGFSVASPPTGSGGSATTSGRPPMPPARASEQQPGVIRPTSYEPTGRRPSNYEHASVERSANWRGDSETGDWFAGRNSGGVGGGGAGGVSTDTLEVSGGLSDPPLEEGNSPLSSPRAGRAPHGGVHGGVDGGGDDDDDVPGGTMSARVLQEGRHDPVRVSQAAEALAAGVGVTSQEVIQARAANMFGKSLDVTTGDLQWTRGELLGKGAFGKVYAGLNQQTGELMAVKVVEFLQRSSDIASGEAKQKLAGLEYELELCKKLKHKHIVGYIDARFDYKSSTLLIFLEYVPGGSITSMLERFGRFSEDLVRNYTRQILLGLEYLHDSHIVHRDLKGGNILVSRDGVVKLADFGASKAYQDATITDCMNSLHGSAFWMAPEVIKGTGYGRRADIWSLGCTVVEMMTGKHPWPDLDNHWIAMFQIAKTEDGPPRPQDAKEMALDFLALCFQVDPAKRPFAKDLLKHPFVNGPEVNRKGS